MPFDFEDYTEPKTHPPIFDFVDIYSMGFGRVWGYMDGSGQGYGCHLHYGWHTYSCTQYGSSPEDYGRDLERPNTVYVYEEEDRVKSTPSR
jgi:hypothetical protein